MFQLMKALSLAIVFSLFFLPLSAQQPVKNYEREWKKADQFARKSLPKSALEEVKNIYTLAKKENQPVQVIKALVYITTLQSETRENNDVLSIKEIENEIAGSKETAKSILKSLLAEKYWTYLQQHRWQLYDRTRTSDFKKDDIATWGLEDFHRKISELYLESIREEKLLQQTSISAYDAIIIKGNVRHLRPTLYDLLAHRAISYFVNDERDLQRPAYAFEINQASAFDPAADFITRKFITNDTLSLQHKALLIYQRLIAFHLHDRTPDALIDVDIDRIEFVKNKSTHPEKVQLYFNAVNHIANQYGNIPAAAQAWYLVANYYEVQATTYNPFGDTTHRYSRVKARDILERILHQKDSSEGKMNAWNLLNDINRRSLYFNIEKVNTPNQPFRSLVKYRNVETLHLRIIKSTEALKANLDGLNIYGDSWSTILAAKPERSWQQPLPLTKDLQEHSTEIKIDPLPPGEYFLLVGSDKDFNSQKTTLGGRFFYVSSISFVNNAQDYFVLNRDNGQPLAKAAVQVWKRKYDPKSSKYTKVKERLYHTDVNGYFHFEKSDTKNTYGEYSLLDISIGNERLFIDELQPDYYYEQYQIASELKETKSVFLFADRSLYRPGQVVYFKGIVVNQNLKEKKATALTGYKTKVYLQDANNEDIDSLDVTTNEYGSFSGKFQLPQSGLNGEFTITTKDDEGDLNIRVEEYKRPKFSVEYEPIKGTYKVNDTIKVTGIAKAYAGNNIDGATVKYRVVRNARFIYPWLYRRSWLPRTQPMEIAHGEIKTDKDGKFIIEFKAIPDLTIDRKLDPVFDYTVYADVSDINGETRSGNKNVSVSYKALLLQTNIPAILPTDSLKSLSIRTENMNGEFEASTIYVTISKLKGEKRLIRDRYWERPDQFTLAKNEYISLFPYDEYDNESDFKSWGKVKVVFEKSDSARVNGQWPISNGQLAIGNGQIGPGFYVVEITARGKNGDEVKDVQYIELFDQKSKELNRPEYLWAGIKETTVEPGETAKVELGTAADNLFVIQQINKNQDGTNRDRNNYIFSNWNKEKKVFPFPATEVERGGYVVGWLFVKHNRFFQYNQSISVPWTNKELAIEYATYRDKTLPGAEEKWKVKLTGNKKEKVMAEMLASMYDASLDQFYPHQWDVPEIWPYHMQAFPWTSNLNFGLFNSQARYGQEEIFKSVNKFHDEFMASLLFNSYGGLRKSTEPLGWVNPLEYSYSELRNPRLMRVHKGDDVVVTGLGISRERLELGYATNFDMALQGKVAGLEVVVVSDNQETKKTEGTEVQIRKNFNETAFFFPDLKTDTEGNIEFSFTMPEAMTRWKFQALAHTKDLAFGYSSKEIITQKQLMVQPNAPRFLREGDKIEFSTKIVNLTDKEMTGQAYLELFDATTNQPVDGWFKSSIPNQYFTVGAGQSEAVKFPIEVPYLFDKALTWRIVAKSGNFSDGEENQMPVLTNRMLVTETLPIHVRGLGTKSFTFDKLLNAGNRETLKHHSLTVEYTSNPAWYAVQALPYLMEFPYECAEQVWNRYYANSIAAMIVNSSPRIKQIFEQWKTKDTAALLSNLQKNQELKAVLLEETPWVLQAKSEAEQKRNIALLFDMVKMSEQLNSSLEKLRQSQLSNGGFAWFKGGPDDRYITQYIITGIGHLKKLNGIAKGQEDKLNQILGLAISYLDKKISEDYANLKKSKTDLKKYTPGYTIIQYLFMRSFFPQYDIDKEFQTGYKYFRERAQQTWTTQSKYMQGMIALALHRTNDIKTPAAILKSLKETSIANEELGMYWKDLSSGGRWFWYQAPIETQSLLIEAFSEISKDSKTVDDLRTWLLKNKQTTNWKTTKATAEACYALLLQGTNWTNDGRTAEVKLGNIILNDAGVTEAGTGYFKKTVEGNKVNETMGNITVTVRDKNLEVTGPNTVNVGPSWGGIYWQYFEDLDKITTASTPLKLEKKLFVEKNTDRGPVLTPVNDGDELKVGDKIKVRIELRVDRDMEYVHMKDMRASALEPVNVLSSYKWQGGLGYYESTKDASTNFFFSYLNKGTYVFEYALFVTHAGNFSNGVTTIQCMYAPEFTSHSEGIRINVE